MTEVCEICDIAGCYHIRAKESYNEKMKAMEDLAFYGTSFMKDGKRIDPKDTLPIHHGYDDEGMKVYSGGKVIYEIPVSKFPDEILRMAERLRAGKGE